MTLGLDPGDEVITTPFTFVASVEVLSLLGLKTVFVDVEPETFMIDIHKIEAAITSRTRVILPVHLFGQNADMEALLKIASEHNLVIVEDAAQSLGSDYIFSDGRRKKSGTIGVAGATSFFPSKIIGAFGDGGAVFCTNPEMSGTIRSIANHGRTENYRYETTGVNSRLDSIQAAILEVKLKYIDKYIRARQNAADFYDHELCNLPQLKIPARKKDSTHVFHQYTVRSDRRDALKNFLADKGIPSVIYYPMPLHLQNAYKYLGYGKGDFPVSEHLAETVLSLPIHTEMDQGQLDFITGSVKQFFTSKVNE